MKPMIFVLIFAFFICVFARAEDLLFCKEISQKDQLTWMQKTKMDVPSAVHDHLQVIHQSVFPNKKIRFQQAENLVKAFDADTWLEKLRTVESKAIIDSHRSETEFLFSFWIREKYLGTLSRAAVRSEQQILKLYGTKLPLDLRSKILNYPAEPRVTRVSSFHCLTNSDAQSYRCSEPHVQLDVQLSPKFLCDSTKQSLSTHLIYIVRLDPLRGPLIVDAERNGQRIYQDTLQEFVNLQSRLSSTELFRELRQKAYFSKSDFNEIPGAGLLSLQTKTPLPPRQPASQVLHK